MQHKSNGITLAGSETTCVERSFTGAVMLIMGTATAMEWALTQSGFSQWLVATMASVPGGKLGFLAITAVTFVILGCVLFGPLLFPVVKAICVHEGSLRTGDHPVDGHRPIRTAIRRVILWCVPHSAGCHPTMRWGACGRIWLHWRWRWRLSCRCRGCRLALVTDVGVGRAVQLIFRQQLSATR
jgi:hypothetical protein